MAGFAIVDFFQAHRDELRKALNSSKIADIKTETGVLQLKKFEEIGDGNLNFVYRVTIDVGGAAPVSIVVKHAPDFIKVGWGDRVRYNCRWGLKPVHPFPWLQCLGPEYPLTQQRLTVEYAAMCQYHSLSPGCVPIPLLYDRDKNASE